MSLVDLLVGRRRTAILQFYFCEQARVDAIINPPTVTLTCSSEHLGRLIGPGGATIRKIEATTGANIRVDGTTVHISGASPDAMAKAQRAVQTLVSPPSATLHCPADRVHRLIGRGGTTVRRLQEQTGARINVDGETVTITGPTAVRSCACACACACAAVVPRRLRNPANAAAIAGYTSHDFELHGNRFAIWRQGGDTTGKRKTASNTPSDPRT